MTSSCSMPSAPAVVRRAPSARPSRTYRLPCKETGMPSVTGSVSAQSSPAVEGTLPSFASLKQIDAGELSVGYAEAGPADGPAVLLLHGWPYDIHSFVDVTPMLAEADYRVIVPYLRGYGTTRFLSADTFRNGQQSVLALDTIALMDALNIQQ